MTVLFTGLLVLVVWALITVLRHGPKRADLTIHELLGGLLITAIFATLTINDTRAINNYHADVLKVVKTQWPVENVRNTNWSPADDPTAEVTLFAELKGEPVKCSVFNSKKEGLTLRCSPWAPLVPATTKE